MIAAMPKNVKSFTPNTLFNDPDSWATGKSVLTLNNFCQFMVSSAIIQPKAQRNRKLYNFVMMRKLQAFGMMILVLLASGAAQMAYHICDDDGIHILNNGCHEENTSPSTPENTGCCSEESNLNSIDDCCTDAYFFALSPLPASFIKFTLGDPNSACSSHIQNSQWFTSCLSKPQTTSYLKNTPPLLSCIQYVSSVKCVWII
jgi:hypothetical protein